MRGLVRGRVTALLRALRAWVLDSRRRRSTGDLVDRTVDLAFRERLASDRRARARLAWMAH